MGPLTLVPSHISEEASIGTPPSPPCLVRHLASASKFSSANPMGSISLWQLAHGSCLRCSVICSRNVRIFSGPPLVSSSGGTFGGGSGGGVPRMFSSTHTPRLTGEVLKFCVHVIERKLPLPSRPRRLSSSGPSVTRRKCDPYTLEMPYCRASRSFTNV